MKALHLAAMSAAGRAGHWAALMDEKKAPTSDAAEAAPMAAPTAARTVERLAGCLVWRRADYWAGLKARLVVAEMAVRWAELWA